MRKANWILLMLNLLLCGCSAPIDLGLASSAGKTFHERYNRKDYAAIYGEADAKFRAAVPQDALAKLLDGFHDKLGNVSDSTRTGFNVNYNFGGSTVTMTYATKFEKGEGQEHFVWLKSGDTVRLLNYNLKSAMLTENSVQ